MAPSLDLCVRAEFLDIQEVLLMFLHLCMPDCRIRSSDPLALLYNDMSPLVSSFL